MHPPANRAAVSCVAQVGRLRHTRGGPRAAAARWSAYVSGGGLKSYAAHRNNPLSPDGKGASRMSCFVNLGMISPLIMARDATHAGADKYLSEFCGFREAAYLWCLLHPGGYADAAVAVPAWARGQLRRAADGGGDAHVPRLEELEEGRSGDVLLDDCQRCLVLSGELHNNVRMTWGKAIPSWHAAILRAARETAPCDASSQPIAPASPAVRLQAALDLLIRLNDRYALDGGAPPSYGGLLWCLGWRDRPGHDGCPAARPTTVLRSRIKAGDLERRAQWRCRAQLAPLLEAADTDGHVAATATAAQSSMGRPSEEVADAASAPAAKRQRPTPGSSSCG